MSGHFIKRCKHCDGVISQCRCMGNKKLTYGVCDECKKAGASDSEASQSPSDEVVVRGLKDHDISGLVSAVTNRLQGTVPNMP